MLNNDRHKHNGSQASEPAEIKNTLFWKYLCPFNAGFNCVIVC